MALVATDDMNPTWKFVALGGLLTAFVVNQIAPTTITNQKENLLPHYQLHQLFLKFNWL